MTTGQRIKAARKKAGLTQKELGEKLGVAYQTLAQWENDLRNPKQETLLKIAKALGIHLKDLADNSIWEEYDKQVNTAALAESVKEIEAIEHYLEELGFIVDYIEYNEKDFEVILARDGHKAIFTAAEFEELKSAAKEAIEGKFYKKALEQQNKK